VAKDGKIEEQPVPPKDKDTSKLAFIEPPLPSHIYTLIWHILNIVLYLSGSIIQSDSATSISNFRCQFYSVIISGERFPCREKFAAI